MRRGRGRPKKSGSELPRNRDADLVHTTEETLSDSEEVIVDSSSGKKKDDGVEIPIVSNTETLSMRSEGG